MNPKISVALCTYNGERFIAKQIESIFNQTQAVTEIVICDDGSTDKTDEIILKFQKQHPHIIRYYKNEKNINCIKNFEQAIRLTTGDYIFLSDQDDIWQPNKVYTVVNHFLQNPNSEGVFTNALLINENETVIENYTLLQCCIFKPEMLEKYGGFWHTYQHQDNMVTGATLCIKKIVKDFIFPFPSIPQFYHDEWIALHLAKRNTLNVINAHLISYRIHEKQQVGTGLIERFEKDKKYAELVLEDKKITKFNDIFILYKKLYSLYDKYYRVMQFEDGNRFDFKGLAIGVGKNLKKLQKQMMLQFPIPAISKLIWDKVRNKRQLHKFV
jgi:glycosyltransferase involved in cell wall biosynthesis